MLHHLGHIVNERHEEVNEDDFSLSVFVESHVVGEDIVVANHLIINHREQESVDIFRLTLGRDVVQDAVQLAILVVISIKQAFEIINIFHEHGVGITVRNVREAVTEEYVGGKPERREDGGLLCIARIDHHITGSTTDVNAGNGAGCTLELT